MKLKTSRNNRKKDDIANLLYGYHKRARKIALLRYELNCLEQVTHDELIEAMSYAHQDGIGRDRCHVSNKTPYIALNYTNYNTVDTAGVGAGQVGILCVAARDAAGAGPSQDLF